MHFLKTAYKYICRLKHRTINNNNQYFDSLMSAQHARQTRPHTSQQQQHGSARGCRVASARLPAAYRGARPRHRRCSAVVEVEVEVCPPLIATVVCVLLRSLFLTEALPRTGLTPDKDIILRRRRTLLLLLLLRSRIHAVVVGAHWQVS